MDFSGFWRLAEQGVLALASVLGFGLHALLNSMSKKARHPLAAGACSCLCVSTGRRHVKGRLVYKLQLHAACRQARAAC